MKTKRGEPDGTKANITYHTLEAHAKPFNQLPSNYKTYIL